MEKYIINGQIGEGAQGLVLKAHDTSTDQEVALKKILIKRADGGLPASIIREVKCLQQFKHPYVCFSSSNIFSTSQRALYKAFIDCFRYQFSGICIHRHFLQVVELLDAFPNYLDFVMVFEYMPTGLWEVLRDTEISLTLAQIKTYMKMLLEGTAYVHGKNIIHRVHKYYYFYPRGDSDVRNRF